MKKLFTLLTLLALGVGLSHAYTAQEIAAKGTVTLCYKYAYSANINGYLRNLYQYQKVDVPVYINQNGYLIIEDINPLQGEVLQNLDKIPLPLKIEGNTATCMWTFTKRALDYGDTVRDGYYTYKYFYWAPTAAITTYTSGGKSYYSVIVPLGQSTNQIDEIYCTNYYNYNGLNGTITQDQFGNFIISLNPFELLKAELTQTSNFYIQNQNNYDVYINDSMNYLKVSKDSFGTRANYSPFSSGVDVRTFKNNAEMSLTEYLADDEGDLIQTSALKKNCKVGVTIGPEENGQSTIEFENFAGYGVYYESWMPNYINGTWQRNEHKAKGTINWDELYVTINTIERRLYPNVAEFPDFIFSGIISGGATEVTDDGFIYDMIEGVISGTSIGHEGDNKWLDRGEVKTIIHNPKISFGPIVSSQSAFVDENNYAYIPYYIVDDAVLSLPEDIEYTHKVDLVPDVFGYGQMSKDNPAKGLYIKAHIDNLKNYAFVDGYELYIVPGEHANLTAADFSHENGHPQATRIDLDKYISPFDLDPGEHGYKSPRRRAEGAEGGDDEPAYFNLFIPEDDIQQDPNQKYSIFLKAKYTAESGLEDSFHAMTSLGKSTTGLLEAAVDNQDQPIQYFNLQGQPVANPTPGNYYIMRQGSRTAKIRL